MCSAEGRAASDANRGQAPRACHAPVPARAAADASGTVTRTVWYAAKRSRTSLINVGVPRWWPHAGNPQPYPGRTAAITWRGAGLTMGRPSITTVGTVSLPPATERTKAAASGSRQMLTCRTER